MATLLVMIAVAMAFILSLSFLSAQSTTMGITENMDHHVRSRAIAESGLQLAIVEVQQNSDWRTDFANGTWVTNHSYAGGTFTISGVDGEDTDGDGVISVPAEGDGDLTDGQDDPATLKVVGTYNGVTHTVEAVITGAGEEESQTIEIRVNDENDDADQVGAKVMPTGLTAVDLEIGQASYCGVRFNGVNLEPGTTITSAYIQFESFFSTSSTTNATVYGHDTDNAPTFTTTNNDISSRPSTTATVAWNSMEVWVEDQIYQTPDLSAIVQEIVDRGGWSSGNSMAFVFTGGGGIRRGYAFDYFPAQAPLLHIEYGGGGGGRRWRRRDAYTAGAL